MCAYQVQIVRDQQKKQKTKKNACLHAVYQSKICAKRTHTVRSWIIHFMSPEIFARSCTDSAVPLVSIHDHAIESRTPESFKHYGKALICHAHGMAR